MRTAIIEEIYNTMKENKNTYFLTGDLGYNALEKIEQSFSKRFINVGVAEQNMIGIATGLALSGKKVFVYSIIPFLLMRCYEQIRNDICFHDVDVTLLGIGSGLSYGILSSTHFALEDMAILRPLPNMSIFSPADETEAVLGIRYLRNFHQPVYIRIAGRKEPIVNSKPYHFKFGKGVVLQEGKDITIFSTGVIMDEVLKAAKLLKQIKNIKPTVVNIHTVKPLDEELIINRSKKSKVVFVIEEHGIIGGLGSAICELLSSQKLNVKILRIGVEDKHIKIVGTREYLRKILSLDADGIYRKILKENEKYSYSE
ncbi:transketolase [Candidatus Roizmanbacteria bacterium]|nr:transketolase [Candidatus Roizmanbacteria bacterium]